MKAIAIKNSLFSVAFSYLWWYLAAMKIVQTISYFRQFFAAENKVIFDGTFCRQK
jgi:hypothetical protein